MFVITGCASTNDKTDIAKEGDGYRCEKVYVTGSSVPKKRCTTRAQRKEFERRAKELLREHRANTIPNI